MMLSQPCPQHPGAGHSLGDCRQFVNYFKNNELLKGDDCKDKAAGKQKMLGPEDDDEDRDPRHKYEKPRANITIIMGGKMGYEKGRPAKLSERALLSVGNFDEGVTDPKYPD